MKPRLHSFMGSVFEEMCRYFTFEQGIQGYFGGFLTQAGTWWGMETVERQKGEKVQQSADIDVVAISEMDKTAVVGECKFKKERIDKRVFDTLHGRASLISGKYKVVKYVLFSLSGYTDWFDTLENDRVLLLSLNDLYEEIK